VTLERMKELTSWDLCSPGDYLDWADMEWQVTGQIDTKEEEDFCDTHLLTNTFLFSRSNSWLECMELCPRVQAGGRVPQVHNLTHSKQLVQKFVDLINEDVRNDAFFVPYSDLEKEGSFVDFYTGQSIPQGLFLDGEPNGEEKENCAFYIPKLSDSKVMDVRCEAERQCMCQFRAAPILRLRGLCTQSFIDSYYTIYNERGENIQYKGLTSTELKYETKRKKWTMRVKGFATKAFAESPMESYALGVRAWTVTNDSSNCNNGQPYLADLKLTGCNDSEFTCTNGDCIPMEARCDQVDSAQHWICSNGCLTRSRTAATSLTRRPAGLSMWGQATGRPSLPSPSGSRERLLMQMSMSRWLWRASSGLKRLPIRFS
jgi:hypothetical protein